MNIGLMIAKERTKANLYTKKLAEAVGWSSRAIEYWEAGKRGISFEYADKIFKALGKSITIVTSIICSTKLASIKHILNNTNKYCRGFFAF